MGLALDQVLAPDPAAVAAAQALVPADPAAVRAEAGRVVRVEREVPAGRVARAEREAPVDLVAPAVPAVRMGLAVPVARTAPVVPADPGDRAGSTVRVGLVARVGLTAVVVPAVRMGLAVPVARTAPVVPADPGDRAGSTVRVGLVARVGLTAVVVPAVRADPVDSTVRVVLADRAGSTDPGGLVVPADLGHTCRAVSTIGAVRTGAARPTCPMDSVRRTMARHLHRGSTVSDGTAARRRGLRRRSGLARRLRAAGMGRLLPEAGTPDGTARPATSVSHNAISADSTTTATTPYRSSTRSSADGASGCSVSGFRCTDPESAG